MKKQTIAVLLTLALLTSGLGFGALSTTSASTGSKTLPTASERQHLSMLIAEARAQLADIQIQFTRQDDQLTVQISSADAATSAWLQLQFDQSLNAMDSVTIRSQPVEGGISITFECDTESVLDDLEKKLRKAMNRDTREQISRA